VLGAAFYLDRDEYDIVNDLNLDGISEVLLLEGNLVYGRLD